MARPLVTIAIPIYNAEKFLQYAIQSVLNQTYTNWELLLMEDGSTDSTLPICCEYVKRDKRISLIKENIMHVWTQTTLCTYHA